MIENEKVILKIDCNTYIKAGKDLILSLSLSPIPPPSASSFWIINILDDFRLEKHFRHLEIKAISLVGPAPE